MSGRVGVWRVVQARSEDLAFMVGALFIGGLATDATEVASGSYAHVNDLVGVAAVTTLWWRRRAPLVVAAITFVAAALAPLAGGAAIVSVYTVASHLQQRRTSLAVAALYVVYLVSAAASLILFRDEELGTFGGVLAAAVMTVAAFGWGLAVQSRRDLMVALVERADRAEADQHARMMEARRAERSHIAAEMHDVLAHRLSLLSLHAGAIELRPDARSEDLAEAARVVRSTAHLALDDLRAVIGVLRDDTTGDLAPQPTIAELDTLVAECRAAGMRIDITGTPVDDALVRTDVGRHAYRVVREGLTNARKHAPDQPVHLCVTARPGDGLHIDIVNPAPTLVPTPTAAIPGARAGLIGLRERVEFAGGTLEHGTTGSDDHRLSVWLPWST